MKIDLSEFITNPTVVAAFDEKIILINETQNLMLRANVFHDLTIQTSIIPGEPYTLVLPSANSIYMTIGTIWMVEVSIQTISIQEPLKFFQNMMIF